MAAPNVSNLQDLIAELGQSVNPQKALIDQSIAANDTAGAAQQAALGAQKDTAFGQIIQQSQNKGMFFSGFTPDEEAKYTAGTYLPALANLQATIASTRAGLLGKKADLDTDIYQKAFNTRQNQQSQLDSYNAEQENRAFQAQQAEIARQAAASESAKDRAASAAASSSKASASTPSPAQFLVSAFSGYDPAKMKNYTEREVIPALMANYNIDKNQASALAYQYRKSTYGQ